MKTDIIYNENCFTTMAKMADNAVDFSFTSPPYNRKRNDKYQFYNDIKLNYFDWLCSLIDELMRVTDQLVFINIQKNYYNKIDVFRLFGRYARVINEVFIWEKSNPMPSKSTAITNAYEFILMLNGPSSCRSNHTYTKNHLTTSVAKMHKDHKAVMHPDVAEFFIRNFTQPNDIIYDPCMGTGTTAKMACTLGRHYIGSEIIQEYYDFSLKNIPT